MWIFGDSFDHYASADIGKKWSSIIEGNSSDPATIEAARNGNGLRIGSNSNCGDSLLLNVVANDDTCVVGFAFKTNTLDYHGSSLTTESQGSTLGGCCLFAVRRGATSQVWFRHDRTTGTISALRGTTVLGTSTFALSVNTWYYLEFKVVIHDTNGEVQFRRDGVLDATLDLTGVVTSSAALTTWNAIKLGAVSRNTTTNWYYDDLYVCDGSGSKNNDFLGDLTGSWLPPTAEGNTVDGTPSTGTDNSALVDESAANGDTDYVTLSAVDDKDTYVLTDHPTPGATVVAVQIPVWSKKTDSGTALVTGVMRLGGTDYDHPTPQAPPSDYRCLVFPFEVSPVDDVTDLTTTDIDNMEIGMKKTA